MACNFLLISQDEIFSMLLLSLKQKSKKKSKVFVFSQAQKLLSPIQTKHGFIYFQAFFTSLPLFLRADVPNLRLAETMCLK